MPWRPSFDRAEWLGLIRAVLPFAAAVAIGTLYLRSTLILMPLLTSAKQTGYYGLAYNVLAVLLALPALTAGAALPILARAARDDSERLRYVLERLFEITLIVGAALALAMALGAGFIVQVLSGRQVGARGHRHPDPGPGRRHPVRLSQLAVRPALAARLPASDVDQHLGSDRQHRPDRRPRALDAGQRRRDRVHRRRDRRSDRVAGRPGPRPPRADALRPGPGQSPGRCRCGRLHRVPARPLEHHKSADRIGPLLPRPACPGCDPGRDHAGDPPASTRRVEYSAET